MTCQLWPVTQTDYQPLNRSDSERQQLNWMEMEIIYIVKAGLHNETNGTNKIAEFAELT